MNDRKCEILTPLLIALFEAGVIHREPNQVRFVLVKLGGKMILQLGNFCLVLLPDVNTPGQVKTGTKTNTERYGDNLIT